MVFGQVFLISCCCCLLVVIIGHGRVDDVKVGVDRFALLSKNESKGKRFMEAIEKALQDRF
jgi:hypothetical protein